MTDLLRGNRARKWFQPYGYAAGRREETVQIDVCPKCRGMWFDAKEDVNLREFVMKIGQVFNASDLRKFTLEKLGQELHTRAAKD